MGTGSKGVLETTVYEILLKCWSWKQKNEGGNCFVTTYDYFPIDLNLLKRILVSSQTTIDFFREHGPVFRNLHHFKVFNTP